MIPKLKFGRTGHMSSRLIFGAYALSQATQAEADHVFELLVTHGVNHIDVAPMYGNAEKCVGSWMERHRGEFFLASKTRKRSYKDAWEDLQRSLNTLRADFIDLWQLHALTNPQGLEKALRAGGALEAGIEARDKGFVHYLGVTGHGNHVPEMHLRSLEHFEFDSVMLPYNYCQMQNRRYATTFWDMVDRCREKRVAIQTIKSIARGPWGDQPRVYNTYFYAPLDSDDAIEKSVHWAMGLPGSFVISAGDMQLLPRMLQAASRYEKAPLDVDMQVMMEKHQVQPVFPGW